MQRRNYAALFAALVIGFGAIGADAQVQSVTIAAPDSGVTLKIGDKFRVVAVVRDFRPNDADGIRFALVTGPAGDPSVYTGVPGPAGGGDDFPTGITGLADVTAAMVSAGANRNVINDPASPQDGEGPREIQAQTSGSDGYHAGTDSVAITVVNNEFITYTWHGTVRERTLAGADNGGLVTGIQAVAVAVGLGAANDQPSAAVYSGDAVKFNADADRPNSPTSLTAIAGLRLANVEATGTGVAGLGIVAADTTRGYVENITGSTGTTDVVAGIDDTLKLDIDIFADIQDLAPPQGDHKLALAITNAKEGPAADPAPGYTVLKSWDDISLSGRNLTQPIRFRYVIKAGDFGNLVGNAAQTTARNVAVAYLIDPAGNWSADPARDADANGDDDGSEAYKAALSFFLDGTAPVLSSAAAGDTLLPASDGTISDGTINVGRDAVPNDDNPIMFNFGEGLRKLEIAIAGGDSTTTLTLENSETDDTATPPLTDYNFTHSFLGAAGENISVEFSGGQAADITPMFRSADAGVTDPATGALADGSNGLLSGTKTITFTGYDFAGNKGSTVRTNVTVDVDTLTVSGLFPSDADELTVIEDMGTADVRFALDEEADSLVIRYLRVGGREASSEKRHIVLGGDLAAVDDERVYEAEDFLNPAGTDTGLVHDSKYELSLLARDVAGNWARIVAGTFDYDTTHVVPQANFFTLTSTPVGGDDAKIAAGTAVELLVQAYNDADNTIRALTYGKELDYNNDAVVKVSSLGDGSGLTLEGRGLVSEGTGRARLSKATWGAGRAKVTLKSTKAPEQHAASVHDSSDADNPFAANLEKDLFIKEAGETQLLVSVDEEITRGQTVEVGLTVADEFGNTVTDAAGYVLLVVTKLGVEAPTNVPINGGTGSFELRSDVEGEFTLDIRPINTQSGDRVADVKAYTAAVKVTAVEPKDPDPDGGDDGEEPEDLVDAPDWIVGEDYKGATGEGDQGGFVMLTFDASEDHSSLETYRIWRDIMVTTEIDADGNPVSLPEPKLASVAWGKVDAIPGENPLRVVIAALDGDATFYGVSAESRGITSPRTRTGGGDDGMEDDGMEDDGMADDGMADDGMADDGTADAGTDDGSTDDAGTDDGSTDDGGTDDGSTDDDGTDDGSTDDGSTDDGGTDDGGTDDGGTQTKRAFAVTQSVSMPYELMAETMVRSRDAAQGSDGVVFATLTPEALAYQEHGVLPNFKSLGSELSSHITRTEQAVRAIDDMPPAPVTWIHAIDTPADAGASITVEWTKSADDRVITHMVSQAIGGSVFLTPGVTEYVISRRIGDSGWTEIGRAPAGSTSFEDPTAENGVRYSYKVEPRDLDNVTTSELEQSAMAIRNTVLDADGNRIVGLFGADNRVDLDDFFIFADHFGLTSESDMFEAAFDIIPNDVIDVDDFFAFAESYGKEVAGIGKAVPTRAGLNSDARFYIDNATAELPRVGEEMSLLVSLEDYVEVRGYGFTVNFDDRYLEFVEPRFESSPLGEGSLAQPRVISNADGELHIAAFGETADEGDLGLTLVFRTLEEIEESLVEIMAGGVQDGSYGLNRITDPVAVRIETRPEVYALENNYPNPFNPETTLKYQLPDANEVTLEVFNMLGQVVRTLVDREFQNAGRYTYQWDATNDSGQPLSSGIYFYRVTAGGEFQSHKKMLLLK